MRERSGVPASQVQDERWERGPYGGGQAPISTQERCLGRRAGRSWLPIVEAEKAPKDMEEFVAENRLQRAEVWGGVVGEL